MLISHRKKFIFVRIGKTGGRSILTALQKMVPDSEHIVFLNHATAEQIRDHVGESIWTEYFKFTFVRNPWDRAVSLYCFLQQYKHKHPELKKYRFIDFDNFFAAMEKDVTAEAIHFTPQSTYLQKDGVTLVDFIGRFETLQQDFNEVCRRLNLKPQPLPHIYKTKKLPYRTFYDTNTRRYIQGRFEIDIHQFQYEF